MIAECGGRGFTLTGDSISNPCRHITARQVRDCLGYEISSSTMVKSPLFVKGADNSIASDLTLQNLRINVSQWTDLLPHLKWTLGHKILASKTGLFPFRIVTDQRIKSVFCGDEQYKSRPASIREDVRTFNNLEDLLGDDIDLAIIKLGYLGHKNKAAPGALMEALLIRETLRKPTWVVVDDARGWEHSRSQEAEDFFTRFDEIRIGESTSVAEPEERRAAPGGIIVDDGDDEPIIPVQQLSRPKKPRPAPEPEEPVYQERPASDSFLDGNSGNKFKRKDKKGSGW